MSAPPKKKKSWVKGILKAFRMHDVALSVSSQETAITKSDLGKQLITNYVKCDTCYEEQNKLFLEADQYWRQAQSLWSQRSKTILAAENMQNELENIRAKLEHEKKLFEAKDLNDTALGTLSNLAKQAAGPLSFVPTPFIPLGGIVCGVSGLAHVGNVMLSSRGLYGATRAEQAAAIAAETADSSARSIATAAPDVVIRASAAEAAARHSQTLAIKARATQSLPPAADACDAEWLAWALKLVGTDDHNVDQQQLIKLALSMRLDRPLTTRELATAWLEQVVLFENVVDETKRNIDLNLSPLKMRFNQANDIAMAARACALQRSGRVKEAEDTVASATGILNQHNTDLNLLPSHGGVKDFRQHGTMTNELRSLITSSTLDVRAKVLELQEQQEALSSELVTADEAEAAALEAYEELARAEEIAQRQLERAHAHALCVSDAWRLTSREDRLENPHAYLESSPGSAEHHHRSSQHERDSQRESQSTLSLDDDTSARDLELTKYALCEIFKIVADHARKPTQRHKVAAAIARTEEARQAQSAELISREALEKDKDLRWRAQWWECAAEAASKTVAVSDYADAASSSSSSLSSSSSTASSTGLSLSVAASTKANLRRDAVKSTENALACRREQTCCASDEFRQGDWHRAVTSYEDLLSSAMQSSNEMREHLEVLLSISNMCKSLSSLAVMQCCGNLSKNNSRAVAVIKAESCAWSAMLDSVMYAEQAIQLVNQKYSVIESWESANVAAIHCRDLFVACLDCFQQYVLARGNGGISEITKLSNSHSIEYANSSILFWDFAAQWMLACRSCERAKINVQSARDGHSDNAWQRAWISSQDAISSLNRILDLKYELHGDQIKSSLLVDCSINYFQYEVDYWNVVCAECESRMICCKFTSKLTKLMATSKQPTINVTASGPGGVEESHAQWTSLAAQAEACVQQWVRVMDVCKSGHHIPTDNAMFEIRQCQLNDAHTQLIWCQMQAKNCLAQAGKFRSEMLNRIACKASDVCCESSWNDLIAVTHDEIALWADAVTSCRQLGELSGRVDIIWKTEMGNYALEVKRCDVSMRACRVRIMQAAAEVSRSAVSSTCLFHIWRTAFEEASEVLEAWEDVVDVTLKHKEAIAPSLQSLWVQYSETISSYQRNWKIGIKSHFPQLIVDAVEGACSMDVLLEQAWQANTIDFWKSCEVSMQRSISKLTLGVAQSSGVGTVRQTPNVLFHARQQLTMCTTAMKLAQAKILFLKTATAWAGLAQELCNCHSTSTAQQFVASNKIPIEEFLALLVQFESAMRAVAYVDTRTVNVASVAATAVGAVGGLVGGIASTPYLVACLAVNQATAQASSVPTTATEFVGGAVSNVFQVVSNPFMSAMSLAMSTGAAVASNKSTLSDSVAALVHVCIKSCLTACEQSQLCMSGVCGVTEAAARRGAVESVQRAVAALTLQANNANNNNNDSNNNTTAATLINVVDTLVDSDTAWHDEIQWASAVVNALQGFGTRST